MSGTIKYQKIIKVGNSLAVTLDRDFVTQTGIKHGDQVAVNYEPEQKVVSYAPVESSGAMGVAEPMEKYNAKAKVAAVVTPEFQEWVEKSLEEDKESLKKLANL